MSSITRVEHELWNIFTYYTLHSDPTQPEHLKVAHFIRFVKDCQIVSRSLIEADIQIMMTREVRNKRIAGGDDGSAGYITFYDFVSLLNMLAPKVYPDCSTAEGALRRLLLENVLLLAGRRIPADADLDVNNPECVEVMKGKFGRALLNIYKHYADMADRRRSQELDRDNKTSEGGVGMSNIYKTKTLSKKDQLNLEVASQNTSKTNSRARDLRKFHDTIGYIEFFKFTHDFKLKSTALLTAIQVGDIYLTSVPLSNENRDMRVMTFDTFCSSIILMGLVAYRESPVPPADKVKAILLFMWRAVNSNETALKAVNDRYGVSSRTVRGHAGSLNIHGSGLFSDLFLLSWQADGFSNYITLENKKEDPSEVLSKIVHNHTHSSPVKETTLHVIDEVQESIKVANRRARAMAMGERRGNQFQNEDEMTDEMGQLSYGEDSLYGFGGSGEEKERQRNRFRSISDHASLGGAGGGEAVALYGYHIAELFARKPELAELIYLEMRNHNNSLDG